MIQMIVKVKNGGLVSTWGKLLSNYSGLVFLLLWEAPTLKNLTKITEPSGISGT